MSVHAEHDLVVAGAELAHRARDEEDDALVATVGLDLGPFPAESGELLIDRVGRALAAVEPARFADWQTRHAAAAGLIEDARLLRAHEQALKTCEEQLERIEASKPGRGASRSASMLWAQRLEGKRKSRKALEDEIARLRAQAADDARRRATRDNARNPM